MRCVDVLYNLPDIDDTGIRAAIKLGMQYLDIHHIMLPESLRLFKDPRGNARKDFLDYIEIYPKPWDFTKLINVAKPMRFWKVDVTKNGIKYNLSSANTRFFLQANGFYQLENKNSKTGQMFVYINGHIVKEIKSKDIKSFLIGYCENNYLDNQILELLLNTNRLSEATLEGLKQIEIDFCDYEPTSQYLFFENKVWKVTAEDVMESRSEGSERIVDLIRAAGGQAEHIPAREDCAARMAELAQPGDRIVVMGARDDTLTVFAKDLLTRLN
jgi:hypothetical protein